VHKHCKYDKHMSLQQQMQQQTKKFTNVLGQEEEDPICSFRSCYHKFSIHGNRSHQLELNCVCVHPQNHAIVGRIGVVKIEN
jgi:hypothetical protein